MLSPTSTVGLVEVRVASEVTKLLTEESGRLLMVALHSSMTAAQVAARLRQVAYVRQRWPECRVFLLLDERMDAWHRACWEMGSGFVFIGPQSLPVIRRTIQRFLTQLPAAEEQPAADQHDPLDWLPW
ncbi:hypothetical protein C5Y96_19540 [Blastopirellula marina]|uniref:Response regulatory domain-containing protein n=1 Tax=Blastopirellula marina TaxID=124 RepID=A0A2S8F3F5_9BACT|nr:hypothetical protein C5Y96_19540 [Blastopirellula marina]RCS46160.1 hypothetical protein DTL36_19570 [Bremerella cremea]